MPVKSRTTDTFEYRKETIRPRVFIRDVEMGECPEKIFFKELKKIVNGRFYHTTDTNRFFFDWNNKRYELNLFGEGGGEIIDYSKFAKKTDIPKKTSQLTNDSGFITRTSLSDFLSRNKYVTADMLSQSVSNLVGIDVFEELSSKVNTMSDEIEEIKRRIEDISGDSDYSDEISELSRKISEIEERINDIVSDSDQNEDVDELLRRLSLVEEKLEDISTGSDFSEEISELSNRISSIEETMSSFDYMGEISELSRKISEIEENIEEIVSSSEYNAEISELKRRVSIIEETMNEDNWEEFERE